MSDRNIPTDLVSELRSWMEPHGEKELDVLLGQAASEIERLRAGLHSVAEFNCHPYVECDPKAVAESDACPECQEARKPERRWPPSGHCDKHYRSVLVAREQKQAHEDLTVKYRMKDIAVAVLRGEALPALDGVPK